MKINNQYNTPNFKAKFLYSKSLELVADYAVEKGKFEKLNQSRKNIEKFYLRRRLRVDIGDNDGKPFITFTRFVPKDSVITPKTMQDLKLNKIVSIECGQRKNILKFALEKLIKLGNDTPNNKLFQDIVIKK